MLANSMLMQRVQSRAFNPDYTFTETMNIFTIGETVGPTLVFGDLQTGTVLRSLVVYFIGRAIQIIEEAKGSRPLTSSCRK